MVEPDLFDVHGDGWPRPLIDGQGRGEGFMLVGFEVSGEGGFFLVMMCCWNDT